MSLKNWSKQVLRGKKPQSPTNQLFEIENSCDRVFLSFGLKRITSSLPTLTWSRNLDLQVSVN